MQFLSHIGEGGSDDNWLRKNDNKVEDLSYFHCKAFLILITQVLIGRIIRVRFLIFDLVHIGFTHTDHYQIGEDVEKDNGHANEEYGWDVRIDEVSEPSSGQAEVCIVDEMVHCQ